MKKKLFVYLFSILIVSALFGVQKTSQVKTNSKVVVTGYVAAKGNVPFIYPAIKTEDGTEYMIVCKDKAKQKLLNAQGQLIKFTGTINEEGAFVLKKWKVLK